MSYFATAEHEKERLQYFASPEGRDDLYEYNQKERRTVLEVMKIFLLFVWINKVASGWSLTFSFTTELFNNMVSLMVDFCFMECIGTIDTLRSKKLAQFFLKQNWLANINPVIHSHYSILIVKIENSSSSYLV